MPDVKASAVGAAVAMQAASKTVRFVPGALLRAMTHLSPAGTVAYPKEMDDGEMGKPFHDVIA